MHHARNLLLIGVLAAATAFAACSSGGSKEDQLLGELANLDKETIFERAEALYQDKKHDQARRYFSFVYDTFPNDPLGRRAALRVADTFALSRDTTSLTEARLRYRDFANRYPNDPNRDYALLMVGHTFTSRKLHPDRNRGSIGEAVDAYQQLINLYPNSPHVDEGRQRLAQLRDLLAEHEWLVSQFYSRNKRWVGALWRLQYLRDNYPDSARIEEAETRITEIERRIAEQQATFERLLEERKEPAEQPEQSTGD